MNVPGLVQPIGQLNILPGFSIKQCQKVYSFLFGSILWSNQVEAVLRQCRNEGSWS